MKRAVAFVLVMLAGCGEGPMAGSSGNVGFDLYVSRAALDRVGSFQISLLENGSRFSCGELTRTCLTASAVQEGDFVRIEDAQGQSHLALVVPSTLSEDAGTQEALLRRVPTGTDYTLVVEALSRDLPPRLLGSTCQGRITVRSGNNEPVVLNPIHLFDEADGGHPDGGAPPSCDPRIER